MSPTAQPDELAFTTLNSTSDPSADNANARKANSASEKLREEELTTILAVNITYPGWWPKKKNEENEDDKDKKPVKSLEVNSAKNDLGIQMDRHNYTQDGKQMFFICADHEHGYTESKNTRIRKASKRDILDGLLEAVKIGRSVVFYYSGHCGPSGRGNSRVILKDGRWEYEEDEAEGAGPPYLLSSEAERIYGEEIEEVLSKGLEQNGGRKVTIMLVFDTCHVATFFDHVFEFSSIYRAKEIGGLKEKVPGEPRLGENQLIFIAATEFNQEAGTFKKEANSKEQNGAMTKVMAEFLTGNGPNLPSIVCKVNLPTWLLADDKVPKTVEGLVERLYRFCKKRQAPQVRSLLPKPDLKLLLA
ncbi:hypothetical protein FRC01_002823 [Tulasnella sp. 417]|nr:hypothetical protein FRC01_002823 [Tulasnella sp. 417]